MMRVTRKIVLVVALCCAAAYLFCVDAARSSGPGNLIYKTNSLYQRVYVYRDGPVMTLRFSKRRPRVIQSQVDLSNLRKHMLPYTRHMMAGLLYNPRPRRVLVLGLGGGVIPRDLHHYYPQAQIDVVEIDPAIPPIAKRLFGFRTGERLRVHVDDGRRWIKKRLRDSPGVRYDMVVLDAFNSDYIPFHLMTQEFLLEVRRILSPDGVVVANVFYTNRLFDAELKTFREVFGRCQVFYVPDSTNAMLVSPGKALPTLTRGEAMERADGVQRERGFHFDLPGVARQLRESVRPDGSARVLTDDRAPVNWLRWQQNEKSGARPSMPSHE